jgi:dolichol kinase
VVDLSPSPTRKLMHLAIALVPAVGWRGSYWLALSLFGLLLGASVVIELARRWWSWPNRLLWWLLPTTFRWWEGSQVLGSTWYVIGGLVTMLLWGQDVGGTSVLFLAWGDPAAELVGRRWGRPPGGKTVAGSLGCLMACLLAGLVGVGMGGLTPWAALAGALVATAVERWSPPPDDNLWMPILSGLASAVVQALTGGGVLLFPMWR